MSWNNFYRDNIVSVDDLAQYMDISEEERAQYLTTIKQFPMSITKYYLSLIDFNDPSDPIRKMAIPNITESNTLGRLDTSGEGENTKMQGLQHKYEPTVLLLSTNRCAMYCRHCFRKRFVGSSNEEVLDSIDQAIAYIKEHKEVKNILISGGDPLMLSNDMIERLLIGLTEIEHLQFIRFGTRIPVVLPQRIYEDDELLELLSQYNEKKKIYFVTQFNHSNEITQESKKAISVLLEKSIVVSNQTVLLKGINDDGEVLAKLQEDLVSIGVVPYYVFQCRPVKGVAANFQVPFIKGIEIVEEAKKRMSGHAKRFRYVLSHITGKIEIVGLLNNKMVFKYHQAKDPKRIGRVFLQEIKEDTCWLDDNFSFLD